MSKIFRIYHVLLLIILLLLTLCFSTVLNFDNSDAFSSILVILTISFSFLLTGIVAFANSNLASLLQEENLQLYNLLIGFFKETSLVFILTVFLIVIFKFSGEEMYLNLWFSKGEDRLLNFILFGYEVNF